LDREPAIEAKFIMTTTSFNLSSILDTILHTIPILSPNKFQNHMLFYCIQFYIDNGRNRLIPSSNSTPSFSTNEDLS
jgi:hypothetical protein